jgi:opacity protein-like surface antigen
MKKIIFTLIAVMIFMATNAQEEIKSNPQKDKNDDLQTIFTSTERVGWWVSPDFAWTQIDGRDAYLGGLSSGIIINHSFSIGLAGYGIMNSHNFKYSGINDTADVYLYGGYGGLRLEYRLNPTKMINIGFPLLIGGGGLTYSTWGQNNWYSTNNNDNYAYAWDGFFVIEPGVVIGFNLLKFMRLDLGMSYRYAPGIELPKTDSNLFNSLSVGLSLKFGRF